MPLISHASVFIQSRHVIASAIAMWPSKPHAVAMAR
jgi:hypothetical protein